jgi:glycosyltransferase involved in cell wall biosynthesis
MKTTVRHSAGPRVLFLSGLQIHPTLSGGNLRSFALANALHRHGLEVFVYSLVGRKPDYLARRPSGVQTWPEGIEEYVDRGPLGFLAQYGSYALALPPLWITAWLRAAVASPGEALLPALLREKLKEADVLLADFPFVHPVFQAPSGRGCLRVLSTHNLEHRLYDDRGRWWNRWVRPAVRAIEGQAAEACDVLVTCCDEDRRFFETSARVRRSILVPNGIDPRRFGGREAGARARTRRELGIPDDVRVFLFTASKYRPNREAFDYLVGFARSNASRLAEQRIHILVVGNVTAGPVRIPGLTATGRVDAVEAYFAAADAALNPMWSGGGTNVKMCEFIAARLPILTTRFGARGFRLEDGLTAFLFERDGLGPALLGVRRLFHADPGRLRRMAEEAYARNEAAIDMDACVEGLAQAMRGVPGRRGGRAPLALLRPYRTQETPWVP